MASLDYTVPLSITISEQFFLPQVAGNGLPTPVIPPTAS